MFPEFFEFSSSNFAPNSAPDFPQNFREVFVLPFVGSRDQRKFTRNPRHFWTRNSQANSKKKSTIFFWRAGKARLSCCPLVSLVSSMDMATILIESSPDKTDEITQNVKSATVTITYTRKIRLISSRSFRRETWQASRLSQQTHRTVQNRRNLKSAMVKITILTSNTARLNSETILGGCSWNCNWEYILVLVIRNTLQVSGSLWPKPSASICSVYKKNMTCS